MGSIRGGGRQTAAALPGGGGTPRPEVDFFPERFPRRETMLDPLLLSLSLLEKSEFESLKELRRPLPPRDVAPGVLRPTRFAVRLMRLW